jgi:glutathione synthase/RimK-type ligase-like ATP-grasp enzyme
MIALGVLSFSKPTTYITKIAEHAAVNGIRVYHFSPEQLNEDETVKGNRYCSEKLEWVTEVFPIPTFIYDRCYYASRKSRSLLKKVDELKQHKFHHFLGYGLPNKWIVYQALTKNPTLLPFLPKTQRLSSSAYLLSHLNQQRKWLLKPIHGSQGRGLIKVEKANGLYVAKEVKQPSEHLFTFTTTAHFQQWIHSRMKTSEYIYQPFLSLENKAGYPFDIRLLLQKDRNGMWKDRFRVIRTGIKHHITSNLAAGGKMLPYSSLLQGLSPMKREKIEKSLTKIIATLPRELESSFNPLFEIAIDFGLDTMQNLWILDINSKPGHKIVSMAPKSVQKEIYEAPSKYCHYLACTNGNKMGVE